MSENDEVQVELQTRFRILDAKVITARGPVVLEKKDLKKHLLKNFKDCEGALMIGEAVADHMFKEKKTLDFEEFKRYLVEELATEKSIF